MVAKFNDIISRDILLQTPINTIDFSKLENEREFYIKERKNIAKLGQNNLPLGKVLISN
jgi:hypothetical protein